MGALWITFVVTFLVTLYITPYWIKKAHFANLVGKDIHKTKPTKVAEMGGITVILGFISGILVYIATRIFFFNTNTQITYLLAILTAILIASIIGLIDDILGWKIGLKQWQKPLLTLFVAAPIMVVNAGTKIITLPFLGKFNLGLIYPLIIIPILILIGTNGFNMLAGYNGLEAGQGIIILSTLAYLSYITNSPWLTVVSLCMVFSLAAFWLYNKFPAKIFPGDTLTYTVGALAAIISILGNFERAFLVLFIPYIFEFVLKLGGRFKKESFSKVTPQQTLVPRYKKSYGLEHLAVKLLNKLNLKTTERKVVYSLHIFQLLFVAFTIFLYG
ncbi:glycosyl transferase family 4 [Candidatus Woesearchaeota archaeon]|jgi:UDP-N-acetylglucosamine--dolichyl-phosphate N-acetylglucosaminephosphotransferase|nr:glycosyl transferase family 4 [Candidatus Woesearchaeota archaeon]